MIARRAAQPQDSCVREPFRPRRPSRPEDGRGDRADPSLWLVSLVVVAWLLSRTDLIELGLLITAATFVFAATVLSVLRLGRKREERRYVDRA